MTEPAVSVILPFRNGRRFLAASLQSIQAQDFSDFELLAVDDGSDDESAGLVRAAAAIDSRVRLIEGRRRGLPGALNEGCRQARGRYLARMDADDIALPGRLSRQVAALELAPELVVVGGAIDLIDEDDAPVGETIYAAEDARIRAVLRHGASPFCHPATTIRRTAFEQVGGYRPACELAEDLDLWLRLASAGALANLDVKVLRYRLHPLSASFDRIHTQITSHYRALLLNDASRTEAARATALDASDVWTLVELWAGPGHAAEYLARSAAWYVDWAVTGGYDTRVGALVDAIAGIAPASRQWSIAWALWQSAAMAALGAGRSEAAQRHLASGAAVLRSASQWDTHRDAYASLTSAVRSPLDCVLSSATPSAARGGGYLDTLEWLEGGRRLLATGWIVPSGADPGAALQLHLAPARQATTITTARVIRPDVAAVMGAGYAATGFRVQVCFGTPVAPDDAAVQASMCYQDGRIARLEDANVFVRLPQPGQPHHRSQD